MENEILCFNSHQPANQSRNQSIRVHQLIYGSVVEDVAIEQMNSLKMAQFEVKSFK